LQDKESRHYVKNIIQNTAEMIVSWVTKLNVKFIVTRFREQVTPSALKSLQRVKKIQRKWNKDQLSGASTTVWQQSIKPSMTILPDYYKFDLHDKPN
jgi:glutamyl-tRNA reductase